MNESDVYLKIITALDTKSEDHQQMLARFENRVLELVKKVFPGARVVDFPHAKIITLDVNGFICNYDLSELCARYRITFKETGDHESYINMIAVGVVRSFSEMLISRGGE